MDHKKKLGGVFPPVMTPFQDQQLDLNALAFNIERMNNTNLIGYMPLGSNGEFRALSDDECIEVAKTVKKAGATDKTLMIGTARESAYGTVEFTKRAADVGIDYASVLTPHYYAGKMTDDALIRYYTYVADRSPVPILMYCAPGFAAGVLLSPKAVGVLAQHPNILGMKDTSKEDIALYCNAVPQDAEFYVLAGSVTKFLYGLRCGAIGGVLSMANYFPELCCELQQLFEQGKAQEADALSERLIALNAKTTGKNGVAGVKGAMNLLGYRGMEPRLPLSPLPETEAEALKAVLTEEGFIQ